MKIHSWNVTVEARRNPPLRDRCRSGGLRRAERLVVISAWVGGAPNPPYGGLPTPTRTDHRIAYRAASGPPAFRVILKAAVMALGDNPRFVVTSLDLPTPECPYRDLYSARGQDEHFIKMLENDWASRA